MYYENVESTGMEVNKSVETIDQEKRLLGSRMMKEKAKHTYIYIYVCIHMYMYVYMRVCMTILCRHKKQRHGSECDNECDNRDDRPRQTPHQIASSKKKSGSNGGERTGS